MKGLNHTLAVDWRTFIAILFRCALCDFCGRVGPWRWSSAAKQGWTSGSDRRLGAYQHCGRCSIH